MSAEIVTAATVIAAIWAEHHVDLVLEGKCPGGEVGAHYVRLRGAAETGLDGETGDGRYVMKWSPDPVCFDRFEALMPELARLRDEGYPMPRFVGPIRAEAGAVLLQERLPGSWSDDLHGALVCHLLELNDRQANAGDGSQTWTGYIRKTLLEGADGYCLHDTLRKHDATSRSILGWVHEVGRGLSGELPSRDLVHLDFHHRNLLRTGEGLSGVVDWEGAVFGDRVFDLVTFCFGFTHASAPSGLEELVWDRALKIGDPDAITAYVAHMALRRLDWTIRFHPEEIEVVIVSTKRYMGKCEALH